MGPQSFGNSPRSEPKPNPNSHMHLEAPLARPTSLRFLLVLTASKPLSSAPPRTSKDEISSLLLCSFVLILVVAFSFSISFGRGPLFQEPLFLLQLVDQSSDPSRLREPVVDILSSERHQVLSGPMEVLLPHIVGWQRPNSRRW